MNFRSSHLFENRFGTDSENACSLRRSSELIPEKERSRLGFFLSIDNVHARKIGTVMKVLSSVVTIAHDVHFGNDFSLWGIFLVYLSNRS